MEKLRPTEGNIVVRPLECASPPPEADGEEEETYMSAREMEWGEVLAVGPGTYRGCSDKRSPTTVEVGNVVLYDGYSGDEFVWKDETLLIMSEYCVRAVKGVA